MSRLLCGVVGWVTVCRGEEKKHICLWGLRRIAQCQVAQALMESACTSQDLAKFILETAASYKFFWYMVKELGRVVMRVAKMICTKLVFYVFVYSTFRSGGAGQ